MAGLKGGVDATLCNLSLEADEALRSDVDDVEQGWQAGAGLHDSTPQEVHRDEGLSGQSTASCSGTSDGVAGARFSASCDEFSGKANGGGIWSPGAALVEPDRLCCGTCEDQLRDVQEEVEWLLQPIWERCLEMKFCTSVGSTFLQAFYSSRRLDIKRQSVELAEQIRQAQRQAEIRRRSDLQRASM